MAKLKPLPMPIETVLHSKHLQCAAGPVHRAVITVSCHYWAAGAPLEGLPEETARQVARIPSGHWNAIKSTVMAALADILPELATRYAAHLATRNAMRAMLSENGKKGRAISLARRKALNASHPGNNESSGRMPLKTPQIATRHVNPRACMTPQDLAALPRDSEATARFCDK